MSAFLAWAGASSPALGELAAREPERAAPQLRVVAQEPIAPITVPSVPERGRLTGSYAKLRSGAWGARVQGDRTPVMGEHVELTTRGGKLKGEQIAKVIWTDGRTTLCSLIPRW